MKTSQPAPYERRPRQGSLYQTTTSGASNVMPHTRTKLSSSRHSLDEDGVGTEVSLKYTESGFWRNAFRPAVMKKRLLKSIAGNYWLAVRRDLYLMPLRYKKIVEEHVYLAEVNDTYRVKLPLAACLLLMACIFIWVITGVAFKMNWLRLQTTEIAQSFHIAAGCATACCCILVVSRWIPFLKSHSEICFYVLATLNGLSYISWGAYVTHAGWKEAEIRLHQPYKLAPGTPAKMAVVLQQLHQMKIIQYFLELKMVADNLITAVFVSTLILCDVVLDTISMRGFWFHAVVLVAYISAKIAQNKDLVRNEFKLTNFLFYGTVWLARWFRELQDRAVRVRVKESKIRLERVRDAQKRRRRRLDQSAAEEIIDLLDGCLRVVHHHVFTRKANTQSLTEAQTSLTNCIKSLALAADQGGAEIKYQQVDASLDPARQEEIEEDAFINMYELNRRSIGKVSEGAKHRSKTKTKQLTTAQKKANKQNFDLLGGGMHLTSIFEHTVGHDLGLRILDYKTLTPIPLVEIGWCLLSPLMGYLECNESTLKNCLFAIERCYWSSNPYHSSLHGANVAHCGLAIMNLLNIVNSCLELERVAFVIAALGHDIGHPGRTNNFYINTNNVLAIFSNDFATLESCHAFILNQLIISCPETDILAALSKIEYVTIRKLIIALILSTDMSKHFEVISKLRIRRISDEFDMRKEESDRQMILTVIFKAADLAHTVLDWSQHLEWSLRIAEEYYQQGREEDELGIPISALCNRATHPSFAKTQAGYIQFVVIPLLEELVEIDSESSAGSQLMNKLISNKERWEALKESDTTIKIPKYISDMAIAPPNWTFSCFNHVLTAKNYASLIADLQHPSSTGT